MKNSDGTESLRIVKTRTPTQKACPNSSLNTQSAYLIVEATHLPLQVSEKS